MMRILLYDDHSFVTEAIAKHITDHTNAEVVDQCHTIKDVMMSLRNNDVDILLSDVLSDENAGLTLFEHVTQNYPKISIIVYTSITNKFIIHSLLKMGIAEVVNKKEPIAVLLANIEKITKENQVIPNRAHQAVNLTSRERDIAILLAKGCSAKEIAEQLGTSQNTINNQKNAMLEKFKCVNSTDLVVKLTQMGMIGIL